MALKFQVTELGIQGFRSFERLDLELGPLNVLLGVNGAGKTGIVQALSLLLSGFVARIVTGRSNGHRIQGTDVRRGPKPCLIWARVQDDEEYWSLRTVGARLSPRERELVDRHVHFGSGEMRRDVKQLSELADRYSYFLEDDPNAGVPVIAFYPVNRAVLDVPLKIRTKHTFDQFAAYDGAFRGERNFRLFFEWFREREDLENEKRARESSRYRDIQLEAVRSALAGFMPAYLDLRVQRGPLRMTVTKNNLELRIEQLSDGEKTLLSLIGDIARRLALANPGMNNPLLGTGLVMVDEIDLHLHPQWQRMVVQSLPEVFPNVQFILTTHSPVVASAAPNGSVILLDNGVAKQVDSFGHEVGLVLAEAFGVNPRLESIQADLDALFEAIDSENFEDAKVRLATLEAQLGTDPELVRAKTRLRAKSR